MSLSYTNTHTIICNHFSPTFHFASEACTGVLGLAVCSPSSSSKYCFSPSSFFLRKNDHVTRSFTPFPKPLTPFPRALTTVVPISLPRLLMLLTCLNVVDATGDYKCLHSTNKMYTLWSVSQNKFTKLLCLDAFGMILEVSMSHSSKGPSTVTVTLEQFSKSS